MKRDFHILEGEEFVAFCQTLKTTSVTAHTDCVTSHVSG